MASHQVASAPRDRLPDSAIESSFLKETEKLEPQLAFPKLCSKEQRAEGLSGELRRRPRSRRIGRQSQPIDQSGLDLLLLLPKAAATIQGAQLPAERPENRTGARQPHVTPLKPQVS